MGSTSGKQEIVWCLPITTRVQRRTFLKGILSWKERGVQVGASSHEEVFMEASVPEDPYQRLYASQGGACVICERKKRALASGLQRRQAQRIAVCALSSGGGVFAGRSPLVSTDPCIPAPVCNRSVDHCLISTESALVYLAVIVSWRDVGEVVSPVFGDVIRAHLPLSNHRKIFEFISLL